MQKWFEQTDSNAPYVISSRIRLVRNLENQVFPAKLNDEEAQRLVAQLEFGLKDLNKLDGRNYEYAYLTELNQLDKRALRERRILNTRISAKKSAVGIVISKEEDTSIVLNGIDHFRIQVLSNKLELKELLQKANQIDDFINEHFSYAFDPEYGYLTTFPTNVGTGLRACVVLHLPHLSREKNFQGLIAEMSRFGTGVRGVYGEASENYGSLYEISNLKTLGITEKEIVDLVYRVSKQLISQEQQLRKNALEQHRLDQADEAYKSYGVLKYARKLSIRDAMVFLSQLLEGITDGLIELAEPDSIYRLMLGIQPANLQKIAKKPMGKLELEIARADYLRVELPEIL